MGQIWLWIGVIGMALGSAFFGIGARTMPKMSGGRYYLQLISLSVRSRRVYIYQWR